MIHIRKCPICTSCPLHLNLIIGGQKIRMNQFTEDCLRARSRSMRGSPSASTRLPLSQRMRPSGNKPSITLRIMCSLWTVWNPKNSAVSGQLRATRILMRSLRLLLNRTTSPIALPSKLTRPKSQKKTAPMNSILNFSSTVVSFRIPVNLPTILT